MTVPGLLGNTLVVTYRGDRDGFDRGPSITTNQSVASSRNAQLPARGNPNDSHTTLTSSLRTCIDENNTYRTPTILFQGHLSARQLVILLLYDWLCWCYRRTYSLPLFVTIMLAVSCSQNPSSRALAANMYLHQRRWGLLLLVLHCRNMSGSAETHPVLRDKVVMIEHGSVEPVAHSADRPEGVEEAETKEIDACSVADLLAVEVAPDEAWGWIQEKVELTYNCTCPFLKARQVHSFKVVK